MRFLRALAERIGGWLDWIDEAHDYEEDEA